jgi:hypothetical protein
MQEISPVTVPRFLSAFCADFCKMDSTPTQVQPNSQSNITFRRQPIFNPLLSTPQPFKMPESYAEIEAHIEQALHKLGACEKPNVAAVAREFQVPASRLRA